jgi:hypothetical protein
MRLRLQVLLQCALLREQQLLQQGASSVHKALR